MCFSPLHSSKGTSVHSRNIRAGWAKAGLFPFNPDKVLSDIPDPPAEVNAMKPHEVKVASYGQDQDQVPPTQKLTNATQLSFAERALLQEHNWFLAEINNEAKLRRAAKADILGTARVMSYEDLERA